MNGRTRFVVAFLVLLYVCSWMFSLAPLLGIHFWDRQYALREYYDLTHQDFNNATAIHDIGSSYYTDRRYVYLVPHVLGALVWWNLYFLQLIPKVRHAYDKKLHRVLGRLLMVTVLAQVLSGIGLASTSHSHIIQMVSYVLGTAVVYCLFHAWNYAYHRDISRHKQWVLRMVGYLQTIALQRFWIVVLFTCRLLGWNLWYPDYSSTENVTLEQANSVVLEIFDDSFLLAIFTAFLGTEWYLAGEAGMLEPPNSGSGVHEAQANISTATTQLGESKPLLS